MNGVVLVDKPKGLTSHDVVNRWRKLANTKRVGHLGTLDPMATGLLALVHERATRLAQFYSASTKEYEAEITLGKISNTYDAEGVIEETGYPIGFEFSEIDAALAGFRGEFQQIPPPISAKKIQGVPAYKLARKQIEFELKPIQVLVHSLDLLAVDGVRLHVRISCSAGTYIRSIAHDLGRKLGCGALLSALRRTRSGEFHVSQAKNLDELADLAREGRLEEAIQPASLLLQQFPSEYVDQLVEGQIRQGRDFRTSPFVVQSGVRFVKAISHTGDLIAIGEIRLPNLYHPVVVL